jgi:hypothetical protein
MTHYKAKNPERVAAKLAEPIPTKTAILRSLENGATMRQAAAMARVTRQTLYNWMTTDPEFAAEVRAVEATLIWGLVRDIMTTDDWKAKKWIVEQRDPEYRRGPIPSAPTASEPIPELPEGVSDADIEEALR